MKNSGIQQNYAWIIAFVTLLLQETFAAKFEREGLIKRLTENSRHIVITCKWKKETDEWCYQTESKEQFHLCFEKKLHRWEK